MDEENMNQVPQGTPNQPPIGGPMPNQMPPQGAPMQPPMGEQIPNQIPQQSQGMPVQPSMEEPVQNVGMQEQYVQNEAPQNFNNVNSFNNVNNVNNVNNNIPNNKSNSKSNSKTMLFIAIGGVIAVLVIIALVIVSVIAKNPKNVFAKVLDVAKTEYQAGIEKVAGKSGVKHEVNISFNIDAEYEGLEDEELEDEELEDEDYEIDDETISEYKKLMDEKLEESFKYYKDASLDLVLQYDENNNVQVDANYSSEAVNSLSGSFMLDSENKAGYYKLKELTNKWIDANIDKKSFDEMFDQNLVNDIKENDSEFNKNGVDIVINEITKVLATKNYTTANVKTVIDGKEIKARKNVLKLTQDEMEDLIIEVLQNLKNNEEFLNSFGDDREDTEESLESTIKSIEKLKKQSSSKDNNIEYEIAIYTTGFFGNEFIRLEFMMLGDDNSFTFNFRTKDDYYNFEIMYNEGESSYHASLSLKNVNENGFKAILTGSIDDEDIYLFITADIDYKVSNQTDIEKISKNNVITSEDLTMKDFENYSKTDAAKVIPVTMLPGYLELYYNSLNANNIDNNIYYAQNAQSEPAEMTSNNTNLTKQNVEEYNRDYEAYFGDYLSSANTKALLTKIKTNNTLVKRNGEEDSKKIVYVNANGVDYENVNEIIQAVKSTEHYSIKAKSYYDNGYIKSIEIVVANH